MIHAIDSLIEQTDGMKMLDAGCGAGYLSRFLARRGASVTSIDYSKKMLEIAKGKTPKELDIIFHHGNCERLNFLDDCAFDIIVSNMVIQDLADYEAALSEMLLLLKNGGYFVFSILHPCFVTPIVTG
ncbi:class I SAM-dependent methyltransferase [Fictibacillus sp. NE201]|uniref:Class I SAM-dependent methyltransferase n=1 Tax=Fictibacillus fluitans TaxID=3058422 RepID=A0ABT8HYY1_9BACL|nr:class I SAM-dependent methyltransferase [Fictibacillus sp. NE201]MDN4525993.1 class I SAM-dependent methyltransferase [Fictibacillus sp. NE201]